MVPTPFFTVGYYFLSITPKEYHVSGEKFCFIGFFEIV